MAIVGNQVKTVTTGTDQAAFWNAASFNNNQYSKWVIADTSGLSGVTVRASGTGGSFTAYMANSAGIHKFVSNSYTELLSDSASLTANDVLEIRAAGTTISRYINGVLDGSTTDASIASGSPGILQYTSGDAPFCDDWEGGDL
jgi:hypothetical protein